VKIISLNIWGGKVHNPLIEFIKSYKDKVDVFCFQEVFSSQSNIEKSNGMYMNIYDELKNILSDYQPFFGSVQDNWNDEGPVNFNVSFGQAIFVKKEILVDDVKHILIHGEKNSANKESDVCVPGGMLCVKVNSKEGVFTLCNVHGAAFPGDKLDTPLRIEQSKKIKNFVMQEDNKRVVICGDFNLLPVTDSIKILSDIMQNLISIYKIERTRSALHSYYGKPDDQKFADFVFASPDIKIKDFKVLDDQVSDHLAMYIEF